MKTMGIAWLVITAPALLVVALNFGTLIGFAAMASLAVNSLPFIVGGIILHKSRGNEEGETAH